MHPILFQLGPLVIHTYGFLIAVGFLTGIAVIRHLAVQEKLPVDRVLDLAFWSLLVGFGGARLLYVITRWDEFSANLFDVLKVWQGGLVFFGGPVFGFPFVLYFMKKHKLPIWKTLDILSPALVIGHMFGRFGCLSAGCCYGHPTSATWGIRFPIDAQSLVEKSLQGVALHPTQLYEALALLLLFVGLMIIHKRKEFDGQVLISYMIAYPIIRSIVEVFRGDLIRGFVIDGVLSTSQFISLLVFLSAVTLLVIRLKAVRAAHAK